VKHGATRTWPAAFAEIRTKRARHYVLYLEGYCRGHCAVREVTLHIKDLDDELLAALSNRALTCPVCGGGLVVHWTRTAEEQAAEEETEARRSVNSQMRARDFRRDHGRGLFSESAAELLDDRLPPTPDGWFAKTEV
jgi:hypothetical protein